jgi:sister chromatid cohesion protein PDS5
VFDIFSSEADDPAAIQQFGWVPAHIIGGITTSLDVKFVCRSRSDLSFDLTVVSRAAAEATIAQYILPLPNAKSEDEGLWTEQLLVVMKHIDERAAHTLISLSCIKAS